MQNPTIVALSTPWGMSAIAKVRVSGSLVREIVFRTFGRETLTSHRAFFGNYKNVHGEILDQVIAIFFEASKSYTGEDSLEIDCHGSPLIIRSIIDDIIARGAQMAGPGEYTYRAFLNKKLDLCQAEAVLDVIHATNESALRIAQKQLQGKLSEKIFKLSDDLLSILAHIESHIDFSDEDIELNNNIINLVEKVQTDINDIISTHKYRSALQNGISVAIIGAPNAGKSSLLNALLRDDRALVTDIPGTTRDFISENITVGPYHLRIIDTAGLRDTKDVIENLGIQKTLDNIKTAGLCLVVEDLTHSSNLTSEVMHALSETVCVLVKNKIDLVDETNNTDIECELDKKYDFCVSSVKISAKNNTGIQELEQAIVNAIAQNDIMPKDEEFVINARHKEIFEHLQQSLNRAHAILTQRKPIELCAIDIRESLEIIGQITGQYNTEDMLRKIFSQFCVGK